MRKVVHFLKRVGITLLIILILVVTYEIGGGYIFYKVNQTSYLKIKPLENRLTVSKVNDITTFVCDDDFKILQLSDLHIGGGILSGDNDYFALKAIDKIINAANADLIVITGDLIYPSKFQSLNNDNLKALKIVVNYFEQKGIYWTCVFGNHDAQKGSKYSRKELGEYLEEQKYCLFECGDENISGIGNYMINIMNSNQKITQTLYFMDSNDYVTTKHENVSALDRDYDHIHEDQISWYEENVKKNNQINVDNGFTSPTSLLFMHIPFYEYEYASENGYIVDGKKHEKVCYGKQYNFFDKIVELDSTKGVFCGHDHFNHFIMEYKGITLAYGMSIDYLAYIGIKFISYQRGGTIITVNDSSFTIQYLPKKSI